MNFKLNNVIDITLSEGQKDILIIQLLQEICRDGYEDKLNWGNNPGGHHPDDIRLAKKRYKSAKLLLSYYMASTDFHDFIGSLKKDTPYYFNPDDYLDE